MIWLFCRASGPTMWASKIAAIKADLPFLRATER